MFRHRSSDNGVPYLRLDRLRGARHVGMRGAASLDPPDVLVKRHVHVHVGETEQNGNAEALKRKQIARLENGVFAIELPWISGRTDDRRVAEVDGIKFTVRLKKFRKKT